MQKSFWDDLPVQFKEVEVNSLTKTCKDCGTEQPLDNFDPQYFRSDGSKSHRNTCKICRRHQQKVVRSLLKDNGPPPDICECCGNVSSDSINIVVDHCHTTDKFRGWLCNSCNVASGHLGDKPETIMKLYKYVTKEK